MNKNDLIFQNWKMLNRIYGTQVKNLNISKLAFILLICSVLFFYSYHTGFRKDMLISCLISILLLEMLRLNQKCFYDPSNFLIGRENITKIGLSLFTIELLSPKVIPLIVFLFLDDSVISFSINVVLIYALLIYCQVISGIIGMRQKIFSIIYIWILIIFIGMLTGFLNLTGNSDVNSKMNQKILDYTTNLNNINIITIIIIFLILVLLNIISTKWIKKNLFPDPESFPKKIL